MSIPRRPAFLTGLGPDRFLALAEGVEVLLPSRDEAELLSGAWDAEDAAAKLSGRFPLVVVTSGVAGAVVAQGGAVRARVPSVSAVARDSTGAGDAFTGAFLAAWLRGAGPREAATEGCRAGALAVTRVGGRPPPRRERPGPALPTGEDPDPFAESDPAP